MTDNEHLLRAAIDRWLADPESDVEYAEKLEGRWAVRMRQQVREATTVWFEPGPRSLRAEAYVLPPPQHNEAAIHAFLLRRNESMWRCSFSLDKHGAVFLRGRLATGHITFEEMDLLLGEIYDTVESSFRTLLRLAAA